MSLPIFRKKQFVCWSEKAFEEFGQKNLEFRYGLNPFRVVRTQKAGEGQAHCQNVTIRCNGVCHLIYVYSAEIRRCSGNCHLIMSGIFFQPRRKKRKKRKKNKRG